MHDTIGTRAHVRSVAKSHDVLRNEQALVAALFAEHKLLVSKEEEIQTLANACAERLALINRLNAMIEPPKTNPR